MPFKKGNKPAKPFPKGKSGNPSGRPKTPDAVKALIRAATPDAIKALRELALGKRDGAAVTYAPTSALAAKILLDKIVPDVKEEGAGPKGAARMKDGKGNVFELEMDLGD